MGKSLSLPLAHYYYCHQCKLCKWNRTQSRLGGNLTNYSLSTKPMLCNYFVLQESFLTCSFLLPHLFFLTVDHLEDLLHGHLLLLLHVHLPHLLPLPLHLCHHHPVLGCIHRNVCLESEQLKVTEYIPPSIWNFAVCGSNKISVESADWFPIKTKPLANKILGLAKKTSFPGGWNLIFQKMKTW